MRVLLSALAKLLLCIIAIVAWRSVGLAIRPVDSARYIYSNQSYSPQTTIEPMPTPTDSDDVYWDNSISPSTPGVNGIIYATALFEGRLIVGGTFSLAGGVLANNIAAWDGSNWTPLGAGVYTYDIPVTDMVGVLSLTVWNGKLIAGGRFSGAGGSPAKNIAMWDGSQWSQLGPGLTSNGDWARVLALTTFQNDLVAGGDFKQAGGLVAPYVASWNGTSWSSRLSTNLGGEVRGLASFGTLLVACGDIYLDGQSGHGIASWNGYSWSILGGGVDGRLGKVLVIDSELIIGGYFQHAGSTVAKNVAKWRGSAWEAMGSGLQAEAFSLFENHGTIIVVDGTTTKSWDGTNWVPICPPVPGEVYSAGYYDNSLILSGYFTWAPGTAAANIVGWNGNSWFLLGNGLTGGVRSFVEYADDLIAAGDLMTDSSSSARMIAAWDGATWAALGEGTNDQIEALAVYHDTLYAGGYFTQADGKPVNYLALWDGNSWSPLKSELNGWVTALAVVGDRLIAGGAFTASSEASAKHIAAWDGAHWSPLGAGMNDWVTTITEFRGNLVAGGFFDSAGSGPSNHLAIYDGANWSDLGYPGVQEVNTLTVFDSNLIAGSDAVRMWDGANWADLTDPWLGNIHALKVFDHKLIATGSFGEISGLPRSCIAAWDGANWTALGSGLVFGGRALEIHDGELVVGGGFSKAGGKAAISVAIWKKISPTSVNDENRRVLPDVVTVSQNYPNPFNPSTTVVYSVPFRGNVTVEIYNSLGQKVRLLLKEVRPAGEHSIIWDGKDDFGRAMASGVYFYRCQIGNEVSTKKMVLQK